MSSEAVFTAANFQVVNFIFFPSLFQLQLIFLFAHFTCCQMSPHSCAVFFIPLLTKTPFSVNLVF